MVVDDVGEDAVVVAVEDGVGMVGVVLLNDGRMVLKLVALMGRRSGVSIRVAKSMVGAKQSGEPNVICGTAS